MGDHKFETNKSFDGPEGNNYAELTTLREKERIDAIKAGLIDDPDKPKALEDAQVFLGTCMDMCPRYEREQREFQNDVKRWEINPETGRIDSRLAVKAFHRPAAGNEQALPSDVRPPEVLTRTLNYLVNSIVSPCDPLDKDTHGFVRDRTRSIRQDFTLQNERGVEAIQCHERIVRFHILSLHHMCEVDGFDAHQEMEQLRKALQSLAEYYDDQRSCGIEYPNEAEFRAYHVLTRLRDPDVLRHIQTLPKVLRKAPILRQALLLYKYAQRSNEEIGRFKPPNCEGSQNCYSRFFRVLADPSTTYTIACLCETQFNDIRKGALKAMRKAFISAVKAPSVQELQSVLAFDDDSEVESQCEHYGIVVRADEEGQLRPVLNKSIYIDESRPDLKQRFSRTLVEGKRANMSFADVINGKSQHGVLQKSLLVRPAQVNGRQNSISSSTMGPQNHSIFVPPIVSVPGHVPGTQQVQSGLSLTASNGFPSNDFAKLKSPDLQPGGAIFALSGTQSDSRPRSLPKTHTIPTTAERTTNKGENHTDIGFPSKRLDDKSSEIQSISLERRQKAIQAAEIEHYVDLFARELQAGLIRDYLHEVVREVYADSWREKRDLRRAWRLILQRWTDIQEKRRIEADLIEAKIIKEKTYVTAFEDLQLNKDDRITRKRTRSRVCPSKSASSQSVQVTNNSAQQFWQELDLHADLQSVCMLPASNAPWILELCPVSTTTPSTTWFHSKFGLKTASRTINLESATYTIQLDPDPDEARLEGLGALIFECSPEGELDQDRAKLLSLVQNIAACSDRCFPIMVLRFCNIEDTSQVAHDLMLPEIVADRKSPVTSYGIVGMETPNDIPRFEKGFRTLLSQTSGLLSPLAQERTTLAEQQRRRQNELVANQLAIHKAKRLRNSFYDTALHSPVLPVDGINQVRTVHRDEHGSQQLDRLYDSLRMAKQLLNITPNT